MTSTRNLSKHYDTLDPMERLRLVITAKARCDDVEVQRLRQSCPRKSYTAYDFRFADRLEAQEHLTHVVIIDMTQYLSKLEVVSAYTYVGPFIVETVRDVATVAYITGYQEGWQGQWRALRKKGDPGEPWWDDNEFEKRLEGISVPPPLIMSLNGKVAEELRTHFGRKLLAVWDGFDRFCSDDLGLDGQTVMRAAFPPILERMANKAEMLEGIKADPEAVRERAENCRELWKKFTGLDD
jgi:hypothetical protein